MNSAGEIGTYWYRNIRLAENYRRMNMIFNGLVTELYAYGLAQENF
jgi:hypothetical protein